MKSNVLWLFWMFSPVNNHFFHQKENTVYSNHPLRTTQQMPEFDLIIKRPQFMLEVYISKREFTLTTYFDKSLLIGHLLKRLFIIDKCWCRNNWKWSLIKKKKRVVLPMINFKKHQVPLRNFISRHPEIKKKTQTTLVHLQLYWLLCISGKLYKFVSHLMHLHNTI